MDEAKMLQIPQSAEECINSMRSYIYIDKMNAEVYIRDISPYLAPGFILGVCAQVPFLADFVWNYFTDVNQGKVHECIISNQYKPEMERNIYMNEQGLQFLYTPTDTDFVLFVVLNAITFSMFGRRSRNFENHIDESVNVISSIANIMPLTFYFPSTFREVMRKTLHSVPELRLRMMSLLCQSNVQQDKTVWTLVRRYIYLQVQYYKMGAFLAIGQWYESREKTLAHIDEEVVKEMKHYLSVKEQMQADADNQGISIESYCILNPFTALPYLRNFPCSAYCAIEWKKKTDSRWTKRHRNWGRYGVDTKSFNRMLKVPVVHTQKRPLEDEEIQEINAKRHKAFETVSSSHENVTETN